MSLVYVFWISIVYIFIHLIVFIITYSKIGGGLSNIFKSISDRYSISLLTLLHFIDFGSNIGVIGSVC